MANFILLYAQISLVLIFIHTVDTGVLPVKNKEKGEVTSTNDNNHLGNT
jgi:hypothetical protein